MQPEVLAEERTHTMGCRGFPDEARSLLRSLGSSGAASRPPGEQSSSPSLLSCLGTHQRAWKRQLKARLGEMAV